MNTFDRGAEAGAGGGGSIVYRKKVSWEPKVLNRRFFTVLDDFLSFSRNVQGWCRMCFWCMGGKIALNGCSFRSISYVNEFSITCQKFDAFRSLSHMTSFDDTPTRMKRASQMKWFGMDFDYSRNMFIRIFGEVRFGGIFLYIFL